MARLGEGAPEIHGVLPPGIIALKEHRDGTTLVHCEQHQLQTVEGLFGTGYECSFCRLGSSNVHPDPAQWPPVKVLVRIIRPRGVDRRQDVLC